MVFSTSFIRFTLLLVCSYSAFADDFQRKYTVKDCWVSASELNKHNPLVVDKYSTLMQVICKEEKNIVVMSYRLRLEMLKDSVPIGSVDKFYDQLKNKLCTQPDSIKLLKSWNIEYYLTDSNGIFISQRKWDKNDCAAAIGN
jgi:hypothetical protein